VGSVGRLLLERVTLLLSKLASLRERSECPLLRIKLAHQIPVQGSLAPRSLLATGAAITRPRDAMRAKINKDLKDMIMNQVFFGGKRTPSRIVRVEWVKRTRELLAQRMSIGKGRRKRKIRWKEKREKKESWEAKDVLDRGL
jgi:hypothetical protein